MVAIAQRKDGGTSDNRKRDGTDWWRCSAISQGYGDGSGALAKNEHRKTHACCSQHAFRIASHASFHARPHRARRRGLPTGLGPGRMGPGLDGPKTDHGPAPRDWPGVLPIGVQNLYRSPRASLPLAVAYKPASRSACCAALRPFCFAFSMLAPLASHSLRTLVHTLL